MCFKEAMKDTFVLLVLLSTQATLVYFQPYQADSNGNCLNETNYRLDGSSLCCKKCQPGQRLKKQCSETTETECERCPPGQHMEGTNYSPNCFVCNKCKSVKGLLYVQNCSSTTRSKCGCRPGMYCIMEFDDPYCAVCRKYKPCKAGYGVSAPGTADSDVKCEQCPEGTFCDTVSSTDYCRPHTDCRGRAVVRKGTASSDTVCEPFISNTQTSTKELHTESWLSTLSTTMIRVSDSKTVYEPRDSTLSVTVSDVVFNHSTKSPPPGTESDSVLVAAIASVIGVILVFIAIVLLFLRKTIWKKKDAARSDHKVDANGNCETRDKINQGYLEETQLTSFTVASPEQQCLLERGENSSDQSQCSNNTETLTRTDGCSSNESIGPLQSTIAHYNPHSALSDPKTLLSNTEPLPLQTSIPTQSSSQPTTPQIISPMTTSPHVNVNITFHIGNGSSTTPPVVPTDMMQIDSKLPFGEEEESFSIPQQEAGKQSLMSVQESASYRHEESTE